MKIEINLDGMKQAERFSAICEEYPAEFYLRCGNFCVDPKSILGVLAIQYSAKAPIYVDTGEMSDEMIASFVTAARPFLKQQQA